MNITIDKSIFGLLESPVNFSMRKGPAYYSPSEKAVYIKPIKRFKDSKDMAERVVYHEFGHAIDDQKQYYKSDAIKDMMKKYRDQHFTRKIDFSSIDTELIKETRSTTDNDIREKILSLRDTIMSLNTNYGAGHTRSYFNRPYMKEKEFIAHMFENKFMGNDIFEKYMPELYKDMVNFEL
jgi:hypothetical protein